MLIKAMKDATEAVELIVKGELHEAQTKFNKKPKKKKEKPEDSENKAEPAADTSPEENNK